MTAPWIVVLISTLFGVLVGKQFLERRKPHQAIWTFSLAMSAAGTLCYLSSVALGGEATLFRLYYAMGAMLSAPTLGLGSVYLVSSRRLAHGTAGCVAILSALGAVMLFLAPADPGALRELHGKPGIGVLEPGPWLPILIVLNTFGAVAVTLVALRSAWSLWRRQAPLPFAIGNFAIAAGTLLLGAAGTAARLGEGAGFWLVTAAGWTVLFAGFQVISAALMVEREQRSPEVAGRVSGGDS